MLFFNCLSKCCPFIAGSEGEVLGGRLVRWKGALVNHCSCAAGVCRWGWAARLGSWMLNDEDGGEGQWLEFCARFCSIRCKVVLQRGAGPRICIATSIWLARV